MKKFFSFLILAFVTSAIALAQNNSEHMTFKGVPIDGTLNEFVDKMKQARFTYIGTHDGIAVLQGDFAGHKGCTIGVYTLKSSNKVNTIAVMFPPQKDWSSLESTYVSLKSMLTEKYGEPSECVEMFHDALHPDRDFEKFHKLKYKECTWDTTFRTPKGDIQLSIWSQQSDCFVLIKYFDKINTDAVKAQAMDDL